LTLPEAALVAGLIRAPSALSPWSNYDGALDRSHVVLAQMRREGFITAEQEAAARRARPKIQPYRQPSDVKAAWAKDFLRQQFRNEFGGDHPPDWQVHTAFVPAIQDAAERAVASGVARIGGSADGGSRRTRSTADLEAALVAIDPSTGDILALVGGSNYLRSSFNRAVRSRRQPGSAFKPFVFAAALENGYSPVSVLANLDRVSAPADPEWNPRNAHGELKDRLTLREALMESNNAAAANLQQAVGSHAVLQVAGDAGLTNLPDVPSLALGTGVVSPLDLTAAYAIFPAGGERAQPRGIVSAYDAGGANVLDRPVERTRILSPEVAFQMTSMLRDVVDRGTGSAARTLGVRGPVGGKTGTTDEYKDAWFVGFSSSIVAGVWVGLDQPASIGRDAYAARVAVPIWADFMKRVARLRPAGEFELPESLKPVELCSVSYLKPLDGCPTYTEYFKDGDQIPTRLCPIHQGTFKQQASRAIQGFFRTLGSRIAGLFRR
jgi:penicillin-binding protein 1A